MSSAIVPVGSVPFSNIRKGIRLGRPVSFPFSKVGFPSIGTDVVDRYSPVSDIPAFSELNAECMSHG